MGVVLLLGQAAGHVGGGIVVMQVQREIVLVGGRPVGLEDHVVDVVAVVALAITVAIDPGIQQRHPQAVVGSAAEERRVDMLPTTAPRGFQGGADFPGGFLRNGPGHEVDHPADVLRPVAHRTGAAHHIDAVQVARGNRRHGQLRLAVGGEGRRHTVDQHRGARRQARGQATHADVEGDIAATSTVGVLHLHPRHPAQHIADVHRALLDHGLAADHRACPRMVPDFLGIGIGQPIAHHADAGGVQLQATGGGSRGRAQGHRAAVDPVLQATPLEQLAQGLLRGEVAVHRRGLLAGHQLGAEEQLQ